MPLPLAAQFSSGFLRGCVLGWGSGSSVWEGLCPSDPLQGGWGVRRTVYDGSGTDRFWRAAVPLFEGRGARFYHLQELDRPAVAQFTRSLRDGFGPCTSFLEKRGGLHGE
jgi:hypothetical protein